MDFPGQLFYRLKTLSSNLWSDFCTCDCTSLRRSYGMWHFKCIFFHLVQCLGKLSMLLGIPVSHSFLLLSVMSLYEKFAHFSRFHHPTFYLIWIQSETKCWFLHNLTNIVKHYLRCHKMPSKQVANTRTILTLWKSFYALVNFPKWGKWGVLRVN